MKGQVISTKRKRRSSKKVSPLQALPSKTLSLAPRFKEGPSAPAVIRLAPQRACLSKVLQKTCPENLSPGPVERFRPPSFKCIGVLVHLDRFTLGGCGQKHALQQQNEKQREELRFLEPQAKPGSGGTGSSSSFSNGSMLSNLECTGKDDSSMQVTAPPTYLQCRRAYRKLSTGKKACISNM
jgi:hypothetical protein